MHRKELSTALVRAYLHNKSACMASSTWHSDRSLTSTGSSHACIVYLNNVIYSEQCLFFWECGVLAYKKNHRDAHVAIPQ